MKTPPHRPLLLAALLGLPCGAQAAESAGEITEEIMQTAETEDDKLDASSVPAPAQTVATAADAAEGVDELIINGQAPRETPLSLKTRSQTGSRLGLETRELPASISVVSQDTIQQRGSRTAMEAIESAVGMSGGTSVGSIPNYATRGFTGNDITVMRDGIRQNTASQSSRPLDSFLFDRIEVLKGPASLLYGEGAVGGAVNYVSKQASDARGGEAQFSAGAWDAYRMAVGAGGPIGVEKWSYRADASSNRRGGYVHDSDSRYDAIAGELRWAYSDATAFRFGVTLLDDETQSYYGTPLVYDAVIDRNGVESVRKASTATDRLVNARIAPGTRRLNYNNIDNFAEASNSFWRFITDMRLASGWSLRNEAYLATQRLDWRNTESTIWNPATQLVDRASFFLIYRDDLQVGNRVDLRWDGKLLGFEHRFLVGALYDRNDQDRNSGQPDVPASPTPASVPLTGFDPGFGPPVRGIKTLNVLTTNAAVYVEDVVSLTQALKLVSGLRYDRIEVERTSYLEQPYFEKKYDPYTGRIGLVYALTSDLNVYGSYSRAAQPVSQLVGLNASQADFSLQKGRQYELGAKASFWQQRAELTFAVFDIEKNDLLTSTIIDGTRVNSQIGAQVSQGAELALSLSPQAGWQVDAHVASTWTAEFEDFNENLGDGVISRNGNTPPNVPKLVAGLYLSRDWQDWTAQTGLRHVGEREANNNNGIQLDAYTTLDASITRRWQRFSVSLRGRNLTDEDYAEWASGGGLTVRLADPRSFELGCRLQF